MDLAPDMRPLNAMQAQRLAGLTGLSARELVKSTPLVLAEKYKWVIDIQQLLFRRVCGKVVKKDPVTGVEKPVPFATVHVMDTDCTLLIFAPSGSPWVWHFPLLCSQEEIASVRTDACGNFCVWIPRWDIDWVLHWRKQRICFPDIFVRPNIRDLLDDPRLRPFRPIPFPWPPDPEPGPWFDREIGPGPRPVELSKGGVPLRIASELLGRQAATRLAASEVRSGFGAVDTARDELLDSPAFETPLEPPLPEFLLNQGGLKEKGGLAAQMNLALDPKLLNRFDPSHFFGPFKRCRDIFIPEWTPVMDVPDVTFTVTQDVDNDGDEETIYAEGLFSVRWDAGAIPNLKLQAWPNAVAGVTCDVPDIPCASPVILLAGKMPLQNLGGGVDPYVDGAGYARRVNRPHPSGDPAQVVAGAGALTPFAGSFPLFGCNHLDGAVYYRLLYEYQAPGSATFTSPTPFVNLSWPLYRWVGVLQKLDVVPDSAGWYTILNDADNWMPSHLLLNWLTGNYADGLYRISLQLGNAAKAPVHTTAPVNLRLNNAAPSGPANGFMGLSWRVEGAAGWTPLSLVCPVVARPVGKNIEFRVSYSASASHWRSLELSASGCGGGSMQLISAPLTASRWHTNPLINAYSGVAEYRLPAAALQGAYAFHLRVDSRAFNPDDSVGLAADWYYNPLHVYNHFSLQLAVVNV